MSVLIPDAIDRPTERTPAVRAKALDAILVNVMRWLRLNGDEHCEEDAEKIRKDLESALESADDCYHRARNLEDHHYWQVDLELVEILNDWEFDLINAEREAVRAWVKEVQPKPAFKVGDKVRGKHGRDSIEGVVGRVYEETAEYVVTRPTDTPGCGAIIKWENTEQIS